MSIPPFNVDGILPPFEGSDPGKASSDKSSPYVVTVKEVVDRFATTHERREILAGWLAYRIELRRLGFRTGFQWLGGSFVETKDPRDLDLMVFLKRPVKLRRISVWDAFTLANPNQFDRVAAKYYYHLDIFPIDDGMDLHSLIELTRYFLLLFSHQRDSFLWKGLLHVEQSDNKDDSRLLKKLKSGVWP